MDGTRTGLQQAIEEWLLQRDSVKSAVLFGSSARAATSQRPADGWSDLDWHIVTTDAPGLERIDWRQELPSQRFCFCNLKQATGGVKKASIYFEAGQLDLVIVPLAKMRSLRRQMNLEKHRDDAALRGVLNEMSTCIRVAYRFIKGEEEWGPFYARVATELPGLRTSDEEALARANASLCDALWILHKVQRGELAAAQHLLHRSLAETNFVLLRELRARSGEFVEFGLGRRVEALLSPERLEWVTVNTRPDPTALRDATRKAVQGLEALMAKLMPAWQLPVEMRQLLVRAGMPSEPTSQV